MVRLQMDFGGRADSFLRASTEKQWEKDQGFGLSGRAAGTALGETGE